MQTRLTFHELRAANLARVSAFKHTLEGWSAAQWACALAGETGELCNLIKKLFRAKGPEDFVSNKQIADEMADIAIYLDLFAARMGISLDEAICEKFNQKSVDVGSDIRLYP
jgi:NTP pyrophosphatase (non-canonical NTP hydrolase)